MDILTFLGKWEFIDNMFQEWFKANPGDWDEQTKHLSKIMRKELEMTHKDVKATFTVFNSIFPDDGPVSFDWKTYQLPTLIAISSRYKFYEH